VVFDVNVYLDVASLLGEPFSWADFDALVSATVNHSLPHADDARFDSLRALATVKSGDFGDGMRVDTWTSDHIERLMYVKARQSSTAKVAEDHGLGWGPEAANALVDDLSGDLTGPNSVGEIVIPYGNPPLSHEDGLVYATARDAGLDGLYYERYCVTRDREFLAADLPGDITVLHPWQWVDLVRTRRRRDAFRSMIPRQS
jgi:hypothetical protein